MITIIYIYIYTYCMCICIYTYTCISLSLYIYIYIYVYVYVYLYLYLYVCIYVASASRRTSGSRAWRRRCRRPRRLPIFHISDSDRISDCSNFIVLISSISEISSCVYGRFPKFHRVVLGRDPGTLKSDIVSKNIHNQFVRI